jgi:PAS domain S-box-containing protein
MIKALLADDEYSRLQSLRDFELLDTEPEVEFDEITALAAEVLGMPVALISLVDEKRQWFKSKVGLDIHESDRDTAFCAHAILAPDTIMEVPDTLLDERFHDNPLVADDPQFRFYAGVPLVAANGSAIGTLCVLDYSPRLLSDAQRKILYILARMAMKHIELRYRIIALAKTESFLAAKNCRLEVEIEQSIISLGDAVNMQIESEMLSRQILDVALDAVISVDKEGRVVYWNPAAEKLLGYTAQDVEGCDVLELLVDKHFHEPVREGMLQFLKNGINAVKNRRFEIKVTRADSKRIPIEVAVSALQRRGVNFFTCFIRDLTELNRYLEEQRLSALTFDVKEGLIITDSDTKVLRVNQGYLDIMRCKADDVVGMPLHFLGHNKQSHDFYRDIWAKVEKEGLWEGEISEETHNGRPIELNVRITAFKGLNDHDH